MSIAPRTVDQALAWAAGQSTNPTQNWHDCCLMFCHDAYAIPARYPTAYDSWLAIPASAKHVGGNPDDAPLGAFLFYKGANPAGHIMLAARPFPNGVAAAWSNDLVRDGFIDKADRHAPTREWGHEYLGWSYQVNGYDVTPQKKKRRRRAAAGAAAAVAGAVIAHTTPAAHTEPVPVHPHVFRTQVVAWNEKSFPVMSDAAYRHDFNTLLPQRQRVVNLNAELSAPVELGEWADAAARYSVRSYEVARDTAISTRGIRQTLDASRIKIADKQPGPASPSRFAVIGKTVGHVKVAFIALHLTNGCFRKDTGRIWYRARCVAVSAEVRRVRAIAADLRAAGYTVVIGGDMNRAARITWGPGQVSTGRRNLMQMAALPAAGATVTLADTHHAPGRLNTDHPVIVSTLTVKES